MRTTAWLLPVGLVLALVGGCSSSRFGLAKADPPAKKPKDVDEVVYGNPWKKPKKPDSKPSKEMEAEMAKVKKDMEAARTASNDVTPWLKNAAEAEGKGDLAAAKGLYQKILEKDANNAEAHHRLAVIADQQQDARTADEHYLKALTLNQRDADLLSDMGYSLYLRGKLAESEGRLKEALEANPYHRGAHSHLGLVYGRQGKYDQALASFRQAGTEADAQRNIAQIFPNGRPNAAGGQPNGTAVADNARRGAPALPTDVDQRLANVPMSEIMQRMQQEKDAAVRARELQSQGQNPNIGQPPANAAPPMVAVNPANTMTNPSNNVPSNWPALATTPPPTFNQFGIANPATQPQPGINNAEMTAAIPTNVAKPQDTNQFWTGQLGNNAAHPANPALAPPSFSPNGNFAQNMNGPGNMGAMMNPAPSNPWGNAAATPGMSNDFARPNNGMYDPNFQPSGYTDPSMPNTARSNQGMNEAQRIAAQMAMGTGPGGLLPLVNAGPNGAMVPPNTNNGVNWAYGETSGPNNRDVENAVWTRQPGVDRGAPANNAAPNQVLPGFEPPPPMWNDWQSPAPAAMNWPINSMNNSSTWSPNNQPANSPTTPPNWNGGNLNGAANSAPNAGADNFRWADASGAGPNSNRMRNDSPANNNGPATTIPNWPHAPTRP